MLLVSFYTLCKHQKASGFLIFSRGYRKKPVAGMVKKASVVIHLMNRINNIPIPKVGIPR